jgi:glycosyltransferase involved in cell wall biosynthesis
MKILQVIHSIDPRAGGTTEALKQLTAEFQRQGVGGHILSLDPPDSPWLGDFPFPHTAVGKPGGGKSTYGYTSAAVPWLEEHASGYDFAVVHGLWQYGGLAVWRAARRTGLRYVVFPHGMLDPWFKRRHPLKHLKKWCYWPWAEYRVLRDAAAVLFTADEEKLEARKSFALYRCREEVTGFGIARPPGPEAAPRELFLRQYPALDGRRLFLFLGRLHEKKGCDLLLRAFHVLAARAVASDENAPHLIMAGPADDAYGLAMRRLAAQLDLTDREITWTGPLTGDLKWSAFRAADFFILPSHQENFGIAVVEALACGCPVLLSRRINIWREIAEAGAGLAAQDNLAGTLSLLERGMAQPASTHADWRENARLCFARHFTIQATTARLLGLLESLRPA